MATMKSTFFLFAVLLFVTNTHAVKLTIEVGAPTPRATMPPKPSLTWPPKPSLTMPPKPSLTLPPKPSVTMPPKPAITLPPKPSVAMPPKPTGALPPMGVAKPPNPDAKSAAAQVKVLCQNEAKRAVTITAPQMKKKAKEVTTKAEQWELVGVYEVSANVNKNLLLTICVKNDRNVPVKKTLVLNLLQLFKKNELEGKKVVVLKTVEEMKTGLLGKKEKLLKILMDSQLIHVINLSL